MHCPFCRFDEGDGVVRRPLPKLQNVHGPRPTSHGGLPSSKLGSKSFSPKVKQHATWQSQRSGLMSCFHLRPKSNCLALFTTHCTGFAITQSASKFICSLRLFNNNQATSPTNVRCLDLLGGCCIATSNASQCFGLHLRIWCFQLSV